MRNFISRRVQSVPTSGIRRFFDITATRKDVISLSIGEPDFVTPEPIVQAGLHSLQNGETHYTSNAGILELRQAVSRHLQQLYGVSYNPETEILITVGVSEALYLAFTALLDPGDEVVVPQPCFGAFTAEVIFAGGTPVVIGTKVENNFQVTAEEIERVLTPKTKALLVGYPNNPTGAVISRENMTQIAQLAQKHDLVVISDEIYDRLVYNGQSHICVASLPGMRERTITLGGFSKDYAMTGWRLGYAAAPVKLLAAMHKIHQYTIMSAPTTAQVAGLEALVNGEKFVQEMATEYNRRRKLLVNGLNTLGLDCFEPKGAFYAFPSVAKSGMDDEMFADRLLEEEDVAVVPGRAFGESGRGFVRMCYATAYEKIEEALNRMERFMRKHG
jgi:aminotransferase